MTSDFLTTFFFVILLSSCCFGHGNFENIVCRRVDELYGICNSPQGTTRRVAQGPPGKTGPKGAKGQIGARGTIGPMGRNATVDYGMIESIIEAKVQTALNEMKELSMSRSRKMEEMMEKWNSTMTRMEKELKLTPKTIFHDIHGEVEIINGCEEAGCFSRIPHYSLSESEIVQLINNASQCRQYIKFRCKGVLLLRDSNGWWVSRSGEKMKYWGGATSRRGGYCACGERGTCLDNRHKCNCDQNSGSVMTQDEGYITDKTKLPVRELRFGDMGDSSETGWYSLGPLECWGWNEEGFTLQILV